MQQLNKKPLSVLGLAAINVIAIDSLRTLPLSAKCGFPVVFYYLLAAATFFLPVSLVSAELASGWPETGGVYVWVREAFGKKIAFITIWLQWFYNICWYPTIMSLIAATIAYVINPALVNNKFFMISVIMVIFWGTTIVNCMGMRAASWLSNFSAIAGTLIPLLFIIGLGATWIVMKKPIQLPMGIHHFFPDIRNPDNLVLFISILYGLVGMEMSASHAKEVENPQRDYPKAVFYSMIVILVTLLFGSLAIAIVVPVDQIDIVAGLLQAFRLFFQAFHLTEFMPILALLIVCGAIGGAGAWMLGPTKGMLVASRDGSLPAVLGKVSKNESPVRLLLLQGAIFTVLCSVFIFIPSFSVGFWILTDITSILALMVYVAMFPAAIYLRYKFPNQARPFRIPGGNIGMWITSFLGFVTTVAAIVIGFFPPSQIPIGNVTIYELIIIGGVLIGCIVPVIISRITKL